MPLKLMTYAFPLRCSDQPSRTRTLESAGPRYSRVHSAEAERKEPPSSPISCDPYKNDTEKSGFAVLSPQNVFLTNKLLSDCASEAGGDLRIEISVTRAAWGFP